jgi:hypothetical protein
MMTRREKRLSLSSFSVAAVVPRAALSPGCGEFPLMTVVAVVTTKTPVPAVRVCTHSLGAAASRSCARSVSIVTSM